MPDTPPPLPDRHTVLRSFAGVVHAHPDAVFESISLRLSPSPDKRYFFSTDPEERLVIAQGGWWYRGEWRVLENDEGGSRVEYELFNVAKVLHWAGPIAGRRVVAGAPASFQALLTDLVDELE
ncbi:hypothetical protein [Glaciihabitans sp. dw_435]|uniref:hypothetical protein n=1 Tax=Glaciihabitans sp. dw_435 TaxID=2720081 RepID=UPI001BD3CC82|nr:hypothetical protein [Glaciihabitans sp. dw_435]